MFVSINKFSGTVPSEVGRMTSLVDFEGNTNDFTGVIDDRICELGMESFVMDCIFKSSPIATFVTCGCCTRCL